MSEQLAYRFDADAMHQQMLESGHVHPYRIVLEPRLAADECVEVGYEAAVEAIEWQIVAPVPFGEKLRKEFIYTPIFIIAAHAARDAHHAFKLVDVAAEELEHHLPPFVASEIHILDSESGRRFRGRQKAVITEHNSRINHRKRVIYLSGFRGTAFDPSAA